MHQRKLKYRIVESAVCILPDRLFKIPNSNANPANSIFLWSVSRVSWGFNGGSKIESPYISMKRRNQVTTKRVTTKRVTSTTTTTK